jgi:hypothetical protein
MKLIKQLNEDIEFKILTEESEGGKKKNYYIEGIFLQGDLKNRNGRLYPVKMLESKVNEYKENFLSKKRAMGELGHPEKPAMNLDRVSHVFESLERDGNNFIGRAKIMDTPMGNIVKAMMDEGIKLGVSSRGLGSVVRKNGLDVVQEDFQIITAGDIVADPSAPDAFVDGIMEGKEWVWDNGIYQEKDADKAKKIIESASSKNLQEAKVMVWMDFFSKL